MCSRRTTKRGFTLVELLVVIGVSSIVLGGLGTLYCYTMGQLGDSLAEMTSTDQATTAFRDMKASVGNAVLCETKVVNGIVALRCKMPSVEIDLNGDGVADSYAPASLDKKGLERYAVGKRVWYYMADSTGLFGTTGTILWRAVVATDSNPAAADRDLAWTYLYSRTTSPRFPLVTGFAPTVDATNRLVTLDLSAESADYADRKAVTSDGAARRRGIRLLSKVFWRHWRV